MSSTTQAVLEQIRVCAKISIDCMDLNPAKRPDIQQIIEMFGVEECSKEFFRTGMNTLSVAEVRSIMRNSMVPQTQFCRMSNVFQLNKCHRDSTPCLAFQVLL